MHEKALGTIASCKSSICLSKKQSHTTSHAQGDIEKMGDFLSPYLHMAKKLEDVSSFHTKWGNIFCKNVVYPSIKYWSFCGSLRWPNALLGHFMFFLCFFTSTSLSITSCCSYQYSWTISWGNICQRFTILGFDSLLGLDPYQWSN